MSSSSIPASPEPPPSAPKAEAQARPSRIGTGIAMVSLVISVLTFAATRLDHRRERIERVEQDLDRAWAIVSGGAEDSEAGGLLRPDRTGEASKLVDRALEIRPSHPRALLMKGLCLQAQGDLERAIRQYELALQEDGRFAAAHIDLGRALYEKGEARRAVEHLLKALEIEGDSTVALMNLGVVQLALRELDQAQESFKRVTRLNPHHSNAWYYLGNVHFARGALDAAIASYKKALETKPGAAMSTRVYAALGSAYYHQGDHELAITSLRQAMQLGEVYPGFYSILADALAATGQTSEAQEVRKQAENLRRVKI